MRMPEVSLTHCKNCLRPTLYWEGRRLHRQLFFLKQEIIKELKKIWEKFL